MVERRNSEAKQPLPPPRCEIHELFYEGAVCWKCVQVARSKGGRTTKEGPTYLQPGPLTEEAHRPDKVAAALAGPPEPRPITLPDKKAALREQLAREGYEHCDRHQVDYPEHEGCAACLLDARMRYSSRVVAAKHIEKDAAHVIAQMRALVDAQPENRAEFMKMLGAPPEIPEQPKFLLKQNGYAENILNTVVTPEHMEAPAAGAILGACLELAVFLMDKNAAYGNSALDPVRIISTAGPVEQLRVRIDDKLSRMLRGKADGEDSLLDLVGYYILLKVAERGEGVPVPEGSQLVPQREKP